MVMVVSPPNSNPIRGRRNRGRSPTTTTNQLTQTGLSRSVRLTSEEAVLEDILATANGDFTQYPDIVEISRGQLQYSPTPTIVWPNANTLKSALDRLATEKRIKMENDRAERIANAVGSAVVVIPTSTRAFGVMIIVAAGLGLVMMSRKPWTSSPLLNAIVDTTIYGGMFLVSLYIIVKMSNAKSAAKGAASRDQLIATP